MSSINITSLAPGGYYDQTHYFPLAFDNHCITAQATSAQGSNRVTIFAITYTYIKIHHINENLSTNANNIAAYILGIGY